MSQSIISVSNLGKRYKIGNPGAQNRYKTIRDVIAQKAASIWPFGARRPSDNHESGEFWALNGIDLSINPGEITGVIGHNGAGKSTLLKVLSRITEPTHGRIVLRGRIASLLEVGTGFHPELTGRENIFLNGAILGMSRNEIKANFDEIVAFAGVERFLDTPVKRYSSGMYVRLAFAVAAHIETEILIIDEVLAVGDAQFQKKCLGKMGDVARSGRTILFVSHNMNAVEELCTRAILLEKGKIKKDSGDVRSVLTEYLFSPDDDGAAVWINDHPGKNNYFTVRRLSVTDEDGNALSMPIRNDASMWVEIQGDVHDPDEALCIGCAIFSEEGHLLYWSYHTDAPQTKWPSLKPGTLRCRSRVPIRFFNEGSYRIEAIASLHCRQWLYEPGVNAPHVNLTINGGLSDSPYWMARRPGILAPAMDWKVEQTEFPGPYQNAVEALTRI